MPSRKELEFAPATFEAAEFEAVTFGATEDRDDPLAVAEYTGDPETDSAAELAVVKSEFQQRAEREDKRRQKATDSEYWICLCFQSREQVEEFLRVSGWGPTSAKYLDGQKIANRIGIAITPDTTGFGMTRVDKRFSSMALGVSD